VSPLAYSFSLFISLSLLQQAACFAQTTVSHLISSSRPYTRETTDESAASHVSALPEMWALIARNSGFVGAWRLTGVCTATREGATV